MDILKKIEILLNESSPYVSLNVDFDDHYKKKYNYVHYNMETNEVTYSASHHFPIGSHLDDSSKELAQNVGLTLLPIKY